MLRLVTLLCVVAAVFGTPLKDVPRQDGRIVGGDDATMEEYPYQLSLYFGDIYECGAVIISQLWALTAAQCAGGSIVNMHLRAGSVRHASGGFRHNVSQKIVHLNYNQATSDYDIALLKVDTQFVFIDVVYHVQPIALPELTAADPADGDAVTVIGWGLTTPGGINSNTLQFVDVAIVDRSKCEDAYGAAAITDRMVCAGNYDDGGVDSCQGDSGGPLVTKADPEGHVLLGIVSWGRGCALAGFPGVYTKVSTFRSWILANTGV